MAGDAGELKPPGQLPPPVSTPLTVSAQTILAIVSEANFRASKHHPKIFLVDHRQTLTFDHACIHCLALPPLV